MLVSLGKPIRIGECTVAPSLSANLVIFQTMKTKGTIHSDSGLINATEFLQLLRYLLAANSHCFT